MQVSTAVRFSDGISPTFTEGPGGGGGGFSNLPIGSTESMRSRTFLENAIRWRPIVKKYRALKDGEAGSSEKDEDGPSAQLVNPLHQRREDEGAAGSAASNATHGGDRRESRAE